MEGDPRFLSPKGENLSPKRENPIAVERFGIALVCDQTRDARFVIGGARYLTRRARFPIGVERDPLRGVRYPIRDVRYWIRGVRYLIRLLQS
jgi:hypothetical protein